MEIVYILLIKNNLTKLQIQLLNKDMSSVAIAKMCGTSTEMIDKYYTSNMASDTMMDTFNKVKDGHLKIVS